MEMSLDARSPRIDESANDAGSKLYSESSGLKTQQSWSRPIESIVAPTQSNPIVEDGRSREGHPVWTGGIGGRINQNFINSKSEGSLSTDKWIIPDLTKGELPRFGLRDGLQFGFHPGSINGGDGGPRGLIRVWTPTMPGGEYNLSNFIAVEPTAKGNPEKGLSELEASQGAGDWKPGKLMTVDPNSIKIKEIAPGVEELSMTCDVERFHNGSHVSLEISERSDRPDEVKFKINATPDSAPIDNCILTATWGNLTRSREVWLNDGIVNSLEIPSYRNYKGYDFAPDQYYGFDRLQKMPDGSVAAAMASNETHPETIHPVFGSGAWYWGARPVTQYWKADPDPATHLRVNGRFKYWNSKWAQADGVEVTGGTTFENFEMRAPFHQGQQYTFGVSTKTPEQLGFGRKV